MKRLLGLLATSIALVTSGALSAADTATVFVTFNILRTTDLAFSGSPETFNVVPECGAAIDTTTTYSVLTNNANMSIYGMLDYDLPPGVNLWVNLEPPTGASSTTQYLSSIPIALVNGISNTNHSALTVNYSMTADYTSTPTIAPQVRTITYTLGT